MKRIVHIDDEPEIRELLAGCLQSAGYEVKSMATSTEALAEIKHARPDLVICDLQLDESDGLETIDQVRVLAPDVPVILLTGVLLAPHIARETVQKRNLVYLEKTSSLQRIVDEIRRIIP